MSGCRARWHTLEGRCSRDFLGTGDEASLFQGEWRGEGGYSELVGSECGGRGACGVAP